MAFTGFPPDARRFYEELAQDTTKAFWQANRHRYEEHVRAPVELLLDALLDEDAITAWECTPPCLHTAEVAERVVEVWRGTVPLCRRRDDACAG